MFDAVQPDLVLLDVMLPKVSGIDVCRELRKREPGADHHGHGQGRRDRHRRRPRGRRRRLRHQAVPAARAGGPHAGRAAPARRPTRRRRRRSATRSLEVGDVRARPRAPRGRRSAASEVQLPLKEFELLAAAARERRPGADPRHADRPGVGRRLRGRHQDPRRPHQAAALQGRGRPVRPRRRIVTIRGLGYKYEAPEAEPVGGPATGSVRWTS